MSENPCFTYWVVGCRTPECGTIILDVIGPCHLGRVVYLQECRDFEVTCLGCMKTYAYSRGDVSYKDIPREPTLADQNNSFRDAIQLELHQDDEPR